MTVHLWSPEMKCHADWMSRVAGWNKPKINGSENKTSGQQITRHIFAQTRSLFGKLNDSLSRMYLHFMYFICFLSVYVTHFKQIGIVKTKSMKRDVFFTFIHWFLWFICNFMLFHTLSYFVFSTSEKEHTWANSKDVDLLFLNLNPDLLHCIIWCVLETFWGVPLEVVSACQRS